MLNIKKLDKINFAEIEATSKGSAASVLEIKSSDKAIWGSFDTKKAGTDLTLKIINLTQNIAVKKYSKFQIDFDLTGLPRPVDPNNAYNVNPFDASQIDISVRFEGPGMQIKRSNAFWSVPYIRDLTSPVPGGYQNGTLPLRPTHAGLTDPNYMRLKYPSPTSPDPTPWHIRFAPPLEGLWTYEFRIVLNKGTSIEQTYYLPGGQFNVEPSDNKGYVRVYDGERNFRFNTNRELFYPIGAHAAWVGYTNFNRMPFLYTEHIISELSRFKGNHCRLFLTLNKFGIENEKVGNYILGEAQQRAQDLDDIVEYAQEKNVYLQMVLEERLEFTTVPLDDFKPEITNPWLQRNPYSKIVANPDDFWIDGLAISHYKNKLRYILARWGYSTNVFAFEFMNEANLAFDDKKWVNGTLVNNVTWWINMMIQYCRYELQDEHMYTISLTGRTSELPNNRYGPTVWNKFNFVNLMDIDFYTDHIYMTSEFQDYRINYLANRAKYHHPTKPYILGEFGLLDSDDNHKAICKNGSVSYSGHFLSQSGPAFVTHMYNAVEAHNALFASLLSGCSGTATFWSDYTNPDWGGQLQYIVPLITFIQGEDLNLANCIALRNQCPTNNTYLSKSIGGEVPLSMDSQMFEAETLPTSIFNIDIEANNLKAEVFALKYIAGVNKHKIIGWVRNMNNWWYNLPHDFIADDAFTTCKNLSPHIAPISALTITIKNVECNATYRVDFYSVYPNRALETGGGAVNGGIIGSITATSRCGVLSFTVPGALVVLTKENAPCAPDYGFKIIPITRGWGYGTIGNRFPYLSSIQPLALNGIGTQIAFRGTDGSLQCYYRNSADVYSWTHTVLGPGGSNGVKTGGSITRGLFSGQIYYHGANDKLQVVYWDGTNWLWRDLWHGPSENVGGDIGSNAVGGKIFYRGADGKLHMYLYSTDWHHSVYYLSDALKPATNSNFAVSADGNFVAFRSVTNVLVFVWYNAAAGSYNTDARIAESVGGMVRMNSNGNILFYRGTDGKLHQVYYEGTGWHSRIISTAAGDVRFSGPFDITPDCTTKDNAQIYFRGDDGFIHVVFMWSGVWVEEKVLSCWQPAERHCGVGGYIKYAGGAIFFEGQPHGGRGYESFIKAYFYGKCTDI